MWPGAAQARASLSKYQHVGPFWGAHPISRGAPPWQASVTVCLGCPWDPNAAKAPPSGENLTSLASGPVSCIKKKKPNELAPFQELEPAIVIRTHGGHRVNAMMISYSKELPRPGLPPQGPGVVALNKRQPLACEHPLLNLLRFCHPGSLKTEIIE